MLRDDEYYKQMSTDQRRRANLRAKKRRKRRNQVYLARFIAFNIVLILLITSFLIIRTIVRHATGNEKAMETIVDIQTDKLFKKKKIVSTQPYIQEDFLTLNEYSRPGETLGKVKDIFVHYTANAGTSAAQNKSYFENLATTGETSASAHFIIGYEGEIIQCIPLDEIGYAVKGRNYDSVSIECCYLDESGKFTDATYQSLIKLTAWLLGKYELETEDILRHYDSNGKLCPKFYVDHEEEWQKLKHDIDDYIEVNGE